MSACNYCKMKEIEQKAEKQNNTMVVEKVPTYDPAIQTLNMNGINVYVYPKDIDISDENKYHYFHSWFMDLPDKCYC